MTPQDDTLYGVAMADASVGVATGRDGVVMRTVDGGATWTTQTSLFAGEWAYGVDNQPGSTDVWLLGGGNGLLQRSTNVSTSAPGNPTWSSITVDGWGSSNIRDVVMLSATTWIVVGDSGKIGYTSNTGDDWSVFTVGGVTNRIYAIEALDANTIYAVGEGGRIFRSLTGGDSAADWSTYTVGTGTFTSLSIADSTHMYAAGYMRIYTCADLLNGCAATGDWTNRTTQIKATHELHGLSSSSSAPNTAWAVGVRGVTYKTTDFGATWSTQSAEVSTDLWSVVATGGNTAIAVGDVRSVVRTTNGTSWGVVSQAAGAVSWSDVDASPANGQTAVVVGSQGEIRRTSNGGTAWTEPATVTTQSLLAVDLADDNYGWAVGDNGTILRTTNGGSSWSSQTSGADGKRLWGIAAVSRYIAFASGDGGVILETTNGGESWTALSSGTTESLLAIAARDKDTIIAVGRNSTILRSTNGGGTWTVTPPANVPGYQSLMTVVWASDGSIWTAADWSGLWRSTNGGANFTSIHAPFGWADALRSLDVEGTAIQLGGDWGRTQLSRNGGASFTTTNAGIGGYFNGVALAGSGSRYAVTNEGHIYGSKASGTVTVSDYASGATDWDSADSTSMFGVCLQQLTGAGAATGPGWTSNAATCADDDTHQWNNVPATSEKLAYVDTSGVTVRVDLVWGFRPALNQPPGDYQASVAFEALAPNL
jgi:photosystem II stability/assembly factor-like uncharacterized protein